MTQQETQDRNKEIALMLGADIQDTLERIYIDKMIDDELTFHNISVTLGTYEWSGTTNIHYIPFDMLQFHSDWNWIMEAVEFIEKLDNYFIQIEEKSCYVYDISKFDDSQTNAFIIKDSKTKEESVFIAVSDFAKKFNNKEL